MTDTPPDHGLRNLGLATAATTGCAVVGALATQPDSRWYRSLDLPSWQPPAVAFPVVWTALYADIAVTSASAMTALEREERAGDVASYRRSLAINLVLNASWSATFWRAQRPGLAALHAATLAVSGGELARRAGPGASVRRRALMPYAAWCGFAAVLSAEIARRNRV